MSAKRPDKEDEDRIPIYDDNSDYTVGYEESRLRPSKRKWLLISSILIVVILVIAATLNVWMQPYANGYEGPCMGGIQVYIEEGDYLVNVVDVTPEPLIEVGWMLLDGDNVVNWTGPNEESVILDGSMEDINYSDPEFNSALVVHSNRYYSRDPYDNSTESRNQTLCIVYFDVDIDGRFNSGDTIWIRSTKNGGAASNSINFRLINFRVDREWWNRSLGDHC